MNNILKPEISFEDFTKIDIRVGTIVEVNDFPKARKPAYQLKIDFGKLGIKKSSAQITDLYSKEELLNKQITAIVNFFSECLILGIENNQNEPLWTERSIVSGS